MSHYKCMYCYESPGVPVLHPEGQRCPRLVEREEKAEVARRLEDLEHKVERLQRQIDNPFLTRF